MTSNMDGVGTFEMADELGEQKVFTCLVKTYSIMDLVGFSMSVMHQVHLIGDVNMLP